MGKTSKHNIMITFIEFVLSAYIFRKNKQGN